MFLIEHSAGLLMVPRVLQGAFSCQTTVFWNRLLISFQYIYTHHAKCKLKKVQYGKHGHIKEFY